MSILQEIEALAVRLVGDADRIVMEGVTLLEDRIKEHPDAVFTLLRDLKPILLVHGLAIVTRFEDVLELLERPDEFTVELYAPKMRAITGDFILGLDNTPQYDHDASILRLAVSRGDLPRLAQITERVVADILARAGPSGRLNVVKDFLDRVPARVIAEYFGVPGPDEETLIRWARALFDDIFNNVANDADIHTTAMAAAAQMRPYLDDLVQERKAQLLRGDGGPDDVLGRLLRMQRVLPAAFSDTEIRSNLIGLIVGWIPTQSRATSQIMDELLRRPRELSSAQAAAETGNTDLVGRYLFEALRFYPHNPGLLRKCAADYTLARSTDRAARIPAGTTVFAATQSAMMDPRHVDDPGSFRTDRPGYQYLHFGFGMHTCFGQHINRVQIPLMGQALLKLGNLRRAEGEPGNLSITGNFPTSLTLVFDPPV